LRAGAREREGVPNARRQHRANGWRYDITTTPGSIISGQTYQVTGIVLPCIGCELLLANNGASLDINGFTITSNTAPSVLSGAEAFPNSETRFFTGGSWIPEVTAAVTPLPPTWTMMLIGLAGFGFVTYRRKSKPALIAA
jgi:hypothetical protein